jgi:hypothetical protein
MKKILISVAIIAITGCASNTNNTNKWHWEKSGSSAYDFNIDNGQCRAQAFAGTGGMLTMGTIMIHYSCLEGKGWYKVNDR